MTSTWRLKLVWLLALTLVCTNSFRIPSSSWRNIRLRAAAADGGDDPSNEKGKNMDKNGKNTSGNDAVGNDEPLPPLKMPRAMIKPITDENEQASPPEQFDSGIGSKNKSSRKTMSSRAAAAVAAAKEPGGVDSVKNNWKFGLCKHRIAFEATETIKRMRFKDHRLCFAMTDGKVCVVDMNTGDILSRYFEHTGEISAMDFDGDRLCSGGKDGVINIYHTSVSSPGVSDSSSDTKTIASASASTPTRPAKRGRPRTFTESDIKFSDVLALEMMTVSESSTTTSGTAEGASKDGKGRQQMVLESLHTKQVTGMRLLPSSKRNNNKNNDNNNNNNNNNNDTNSVPLPPPPSLMVTCGLDKKLVCVDVTTGATVYAVTLDAPPTCLDVDAQSGSYVAVGLLDGRVQFFSARRGVKVMEFKAHAKKVQSIFMESSSVCLTGGSDGVIRRWDLSGERTKQEASVKQWATNTATPIPTRTPVATSPSTTASPGADAGAGQVARVLPPRQRFLDFYFQEAIEAMHAQGLGQGQGQQQQPVSRTSTVSTTTSVKTQIPSQSTQPSSPSATTEVSSTSTSSSSDTNKSPTGTAGSNNGGSSSGISGSSVTKMGLSSQLKDAVDSYSDSKQTNPVVALQGDADKVLAVYGDGMIRSWDATTGVVQYEMQGRSAQVTSLQFDDTMLLVDGTHSVVVLHDFSSDSSASDDQDPSSSSSRDVRGFAGTSDDDLVYVIEPVKDSEEDNEDDEDNLEEGEGEGDVTSDGRDDEDDGIPSSTT